MIRTSDPPAGLSAIIAPNSMENTDRLSVKTGITFATGTYRCQTG
jgi:hypothetical protein